MSKSKRSKKKLLFKLGLIPVLLIVGLILYVTMYNQPAEGTIANVQSQSIQKAEPQDKELKNSYYTTRFPGRYELAPKPTNSASLDAVVMVARYEAGAGASSRITLTTTSLPQGGVTEDSSYKLSKARPELYTMTQAKYGTDTAQVSTRKDPSYEKIVLWPHDKYLLTATLTAGAQSELIDSDLQTILSHLKW